MRRKRELGYCCVTTNRQGSWFLPREQFDCVRAAWLKGAPFVDTIGFHGDRITIKLADVDSIFDVTPEAEMSALEERRANDADDSLAGAT